MITLDDFVVGEITRLRTFANIWRERREKDKDNFPLEVQDALYFNRQYLSFTARVINMEMQKNADVKQVATSYEETANEKNDGPDVDNLPDHPAVVEASAR